MGVGGSQCLHAEVRAKLLIDLEDDSNPLEKSIPLSQGSTSYNGTLLVPCYISCGNHLKENKGLNVCALCTQILIVKSQPPQSDSSFGEVTEPKGRAQCR